MQARFRLSLVCRTWRASLRGAQCLLSWLYCGARSRYVVLKYQLQKSRMISWRAEPVVLLSPAAYHFPVRPIQVATACTEAGSAHAGVPLHVDLRPPLTPERLRVVLSSARYASVNLHGSLTEVRPVPPESPALVVAALAGSASTLTALHGLPLVEPADHPEPGLAAFTRLRVLTLRQTWAALEVLRVAQLPASLTELQLSVDTNKRTSLPLFVGLDGLSSLRRITSAGHVRWKLGSWDDEAEEPCELSLPSSFEVGAVRPVPLLCAIRCVMTP